MSGQTIDKEWSFDFDFSMNLGSAYSKFMDGLKEKKFLGNKMGERTYCPAKDFCFRTLEKPSEWVELDGTGTVEAFTVCHRKDNHVIYKESNRLPEPPYVLGVIRIDHSDCCMLHFLGGVDPQNPNELMRKIRAGLKVRPVWAKQREGNILDIQYFEPVK